MSDNKNFLLGNGEKLTSRIPAPRINPSKQHPYTFDEAVERLTPQIKDMVSSFDKLPDLACPNNETVAILTLHPAYLAKSYFPVQFLRMLNLRPVGNKSNTFTPTKTTAKGDPTVRYSVDIFVVGKREDFKSFLNYIEEPAQIKTDDKRIFDDITKFEAIRSFKKGERTKLITDKESGLLHNLEVALHMDPIIDEAIVLKAFGDYLKSKNVHIDFTKKINTKGLCFIPVTVKTSTEIEKLDQFSFLRVARDVPRIRDVDLLTRSASQTTFNIKMYNGPPVDNNLRIAIFDGGLHDSGKLLNWTKLIEPADIGSNQDNLLHHGSMVTSAFLFGPLEDDSPLQQPLCHVDHYRVLDNHSQGFELFDILKRIENVLSENKYEFFNLSLGPNLPIEDDEVHSWTAKIDELLSSGKMIGTIAVGNNGNSDRESGNARIQVPGDSVNAVSVGASDSDSNSWNRAQYSSIGPGRSPGIIKPDLLAFGGSQQTPFYVVDPVNYKSSYPTRGTSFSAPYALRMAVGLKILYKSKLQPVAIKALLIHHSIKSKTQKQRDVGWGKLPNNFDDIISSNDTSAKIVYQGELEPGKYIRAQIPMLIPDDLSGKVNIKATFCFATETDPQDPTNYTKSGLEVVFRPDENRRNTETQDNANTKTFFSQSKLYETEQERRDAHKWETVLHSEQKFQAASLNIPVFDIHYNARDCGQATSTGKMIPYALIITVSAPKVENFYQKIVQRFQATLQVMTPEIEIETPIQIQ